LLLLEWSKLERLLLLGLLDFFVLLFHLGLGLFHQVRLRFSGRWLLVHLQPWDRLMAVSTLVTLEATLTFAKEKLARLFALPVFWFLGVSRLLVLLLALNTVFAVALLKERADVVVVFRTIVDLLLLIDYLLHHRHHLAQVGRVPTESCVSLHELRATDGLGRLLLFDKWLGIWLSVLGLLHALWLLEGCAKSREGLVLKLAWRVVKLRYHLLDLRSLLIQCSSEP